MQDDDELKQSRIDNMAYIYAHATVTSIAKDGLDAYYSLHGLRGVSSPRRHYQEFFKLGKCYTFSRTFYGYSFTNMW